MVQRFKGSIVGTWDITLMSHQLALVIDEMKDAKKVTGTLMMMGKDVAVEGTLTDGTLTLTGAAAFGSPNSTEPPAGVGRDFDLRSTSLRSLTPLRDYLTIVSNTNVPSAEPTEAREIGGDHFRSSAVVVTQ